MTALASVTRLNFDVEAIRADFPILHQQINGHDLVFLDTAASAQKPRQVIQAMVDVMENDYANVHRGVYALSQRATDKFEAARTKTAKFINAPHENSIIFSRGATEGINLVAASYGQRLGAGDEIITTELEHHSNIVPWQMIAEKQGAKVLFAPMDDSGALNMAALRALISNRTKIVAVTHVANTMGTVLPVQEIARLAHAVGAIILVDGCQAAPHMPVDVQALDVDFYAFSGHKIYGPKGIGALYIRRRPRVRIKPQIDGGGQERGMRSGTLSTPLCVGLGEACGLALEALQSEPARLLALRNRLCSGIMSAIPDTLVHGDLQLRLPGNLNISFPGINSDQIMSATPDIAFSSGSACTSNSIEPSYVIESLGCTEQEAREAIRFGLGRFTTVDEIDYSIDRITNIVSSLRAE